MTSQTRASLKELQRLDREIEKTRKRIREFDPLFEEVEEPALALESEVENTRSRVKEMKVEERRLELSADEKQARVKKLEERLKEVRNLREEAAVHAELDMVRRALEGDEQEALSLLDQIRKLELRLDEQEEALEEARAEIEPRKNELLDERASLQSELSVLQERRETFVGEIDDDELQIYERIKGGGRDVAVAELTPDGACSNCFSMIPLQRRHEVRHGNDMIRCEACGVILSARSEQREEGDGGEEAE